MDDYLGEGGGREGGRRERGGREGGREGETMIMKGRILTHIDRQMEQKINKQ